MEARISSLERSFHGHESACTERWRESRSALEGLTRTVDRNHAEATAGRRTLHSKIDTHHAELTAQAAHIEKAVESKFGVAQQRTIALGVSIIVVLLGIVGYLIDKLLSFGAPHP